MLYIYINLNKFFLLCNIYAEQKRKDAVASANDLTQALVDHLNVG